jgi:ribosomal protein S18 acetylase RimI-like enzyme
MQFTFVGFLNEIFSNKKLVIDGNEFRFFSDGEFVTIAKFNVILPDEWFNEKYVILHDLKTFKKYRKRGFAKSMLNEIFEYVKEKLKINLITLIVYKDNPKAVNLYFGCGFEIFIEYEDSYSLIKKL